MKVWIAPIVGVAALVACSTVANHAGGQSRSVALKLDALAIIGARLAGELRPASAFDAISRREQRSAAIFMEMGAVLTHPRCTNCHPRADTPLQGDQRVAHSPPVTRGPDGHGAAGLQCNTCHGETNVAFTGAPGGVPGKPHWALAPIEMAWDGRTVAEICQQLRDPARNGGRTLAEIHRHNAEDALVGHGWDPGAGRESAPGTQAAFGALTQAWIDTGAVCPAT